MANPTDLKFSELKAHFPYVKWREPLRVYVGENKGWACRVCLVRLAFLIRGDLKLFENADEISTHYEEVHLNDE